MIWITSAQRQTLRELWDVRSDRDGSFPKPKRRHRGTLQALEDAGHIRRLPPTPFLPRWVFTKAGEAEVFRGRKGFKLRY